MHILKLSGVHAKLATLKNTQKQVAQLILTSESHFLFALISNEHRLFVSKKKNEKAEMCIVSSTPKGCHELQSIESPFCSHVRAGFVMNRFPFRWSL